MIYHSIPSKKTELLGMAKMYVCLHCSWGDQSDDVFVALEGDFMKPRIEEVDQLLKLGVNVTIYNGQVYIPRSDSTELTD
jgi:hypothetical protein